MFLSNFSEDVGTMEKLTMEELREMANSESENPEFSGEACMYSMIMESNNVLHNLNMSTVLLEHVAVMNGDIQLLEDGIGEYVAKFIAAVNKFLKRIKDWFINATKRLAVFAIQSSKYLNSTGKDLKPEDAKGMESVKGYGLGRNVEDALKALKKVDIRTAVGKDKKDIVADAAKMALKNITGRETSKLTFSDAIKVYLRGGDKKKDLTANYIGKNLESYKKVLGKISSNTASFKKLSDSISKLSNKAIAAAKKMEKGDKTSINLAKSYKAAADVVSVAVSSIFEVYAERVIEAFRVLRAVNANKKKSKKKSESAYILEDENILADFGFSYDI